MQLLAGLAEARGQARLDVHVHVLKLRAPDELAGVDLGLDFLQALHDRVALLGGEHADMGEHRRVGNRALDVVAVQATVEADRGGERLDEGIGGFGETSAPGFLVGHDRFRSVGDGYCVIYPRQAGKHRPARGAIRHAAVYPARAPGHR